MKRTVLITGALSAAMAMDALNHEAAQEAVYALKPSPDVDEFLRHGPFGRVATVNTGRRAEKEAIRANKAERKRLRREAKRSRP